MKRGTHAVVVPVVSRGALPLAPLSPAFSSKFRVSVLWYGPQPRLERAVAEPKRFKVNATLTIEGELTADELRSFLLPVERVGGRVLVNSAQTPEAAPPPAESSEDAWKRGLADRVQEVVRFYREQLGELPEQLVPALGSWVPELTEEVVREGILATAGSGIQGPQSRYEWLRSWIRLKRSAIRRGMR